MSKYQGSTKISNTSEEEDYYFLQPMFEKHPPNEILSNKYAPDTVPQVKLITNKDERRNNINFVPPKTKSTEMETYAALFNVFDYLGKQYGDRICQIVYLKFNNTKYNLMADARLRTRIMSAFYVPFQLLYSHQETYVTRNMGLNFPEIEPNACLPTAKYNRGCSFDPIFCSNSESGNLFASFRKSPFEYDLILQNDTNSCQTVSWFNFSVEFSQEGYYTFRIVNMTTDMSRLFDKGLKIMTYHVNSLTAKPPRRNGQGWNLCGQNIKFTKSNIDRQNKSGEKYYELYFEYKCRNKHEIVMFALDLPYNSLEMERFYNKLIVKKQRGMITMEKFEYGKTISGSPLVSYLITRKKTRGDQIQTSPHLSETHLQSKQKLRSINLSPISNNCLPLIDNRNKSIIILGRINGVDISSSFLIEGMIEYLLDCIEFDSLKKVYNFYFLPMVNIDSVKYGNTSTNLTGSQLNGTWKNPHKEYQPEIYWLKDYMNEINKDYPISMVVNLTSEQQDLYTSIFGVKNLTDQCEDCRIFPLILSKRNRIVSYQKSIFMQRGSNNSMCCVLNELYPKALVYQFNVSHFEFIRRFDQTVDPSKIDETDLRQCTSDSYRNFGREFLSNYLEHVKLYDKNTLLKDKWVKEIEEMETRISRRNYFFEEERKVEERFQPAFYSISTFKEQPSLREIKTSNSLLSSKFITAKPANESITRLQNLKLDKANRTIAPLSSNEFIKKKENEGYFKTNTEIIQSNQKSQDILDFQIEKPFSMFRVPEKKTSILRHCPPNTLNFLGDGKYKKADFLKSDKKQKTILEKQLLKKELSTKLLKKVKIEDTLRGRVSRQKLLDIANHS